MCCDSKYPFFFIPSMSGVVSISSHVIGLGSAAPPVKISANLFEELLVEDACCKDSITFQVYSII